MLTKIIIVLIILIGFQVINDKLTLTGESVDELRKELNPFALEIKESKNDN